MPFINLNHFSKASPNFEAKISKLRVLLRELRNFDLPEHIITFINTEIADINELKGSDKKDNRIVQKHQQNILRKLEKELKIVPKNHYRNLWMPLLMSVFGIPLGVALGTGLGNMAFLAIGLPIGLSIGLALGSGMDQKAAKEGRQLNFTVSP